MPAPLWLLGLALAAALCALGLAAAPLPWTTAEAAGTFAPPWNLSGARLLSADPMRQPDGAPAAGATPGAPSSPPVRVRWSPPPLGAEPDAPQLLYTVHAQTSAMTQGSDVCEVAHPVLECLIPAGALPSTAQSLSLQLVVECRDGNRVGGRRCSAAHSLPLQLSFQSPWTPLVEAQPRARTASLRKETKGSASTRRQYLTGGRTPERQQDEQAARYMQSGSVFDAAHGDSATGAVGRAVLVCAVPAGLDLGTVAGTTRSAPGEWRCRQCTVGHRTLRAR